MYSNGNYTRTRKQQYRNYNCQIELLAQRYNYGRPVQEDMSGYKVAQIYEKVGRTIVTQVYTRKFNKAGNENTWIKFKRIDFTDGQLTKIDGFMTLERGGTSVGKYNNPLLNRPLVKIVFDVKTRPCYSLSQAKGRVAIDVEKCEYLTAYCDRMNQKDETTHYIPAIICIWNDDMITYHNLYKDDSWKTDREIVNVNRKVHNDNHWTNQKKTQAYLSIEPKKGCLKDCVSCDFTFDIAV